MSNANQVLGGAEASFAVARVALLRVMRGRAMWVVLGLSCLPLAWAGLLKAFPTDDAADWRSIVELWAYLVTILVPVLLAGSIGEEIEERTASYLWSRPLPRWSIIGGKLVALVPTLWVILLASLLVTGVLFPNGLQDPLRLVAGVLLGITGVSCVTAGIAALAPRYGTLLALGYLVVLDRNLAWFSGSIAKVSVLFHTLNLAGVHAAGEPASEAAIWLCAISAVGVGVALWRIRRME